MLSLTSPGPPRSPVALARQLLELGVQPGSVLMVHASLRSMGPVEGGADGVLDGLLDALGPEGTLLMVLGADADEPFQAERTPADPEMGVLAEVFRQRRGVLVSDHAASRYAATGRKAEALLHDPPLHDYHGPGSTLERLHDLGGEVLRLGADRDSLTLTHLAEYRAEIPTKRRLRIRYRRADIGDQWIEGLDDDDGIVDEPDDSDYFESLLIDFLESGAARTGPVGECTAELLDARTFVGFAVDWLERHLA